MLQCKHENSVGEMGLFIVCLSFISACSAILDYDECKTAGDCSGEDLICDKGYCVKSNIDIDIDSDTDTDTDTGTAPILPNLYTDECTRIYGVSSDEEALSEDTILLGAVLPYSGELSAKGPKIGEGIELAVDEINSADGVLGKNVAVLFCDSGTDTAKTERALQHMISLERIHAVIGPVASDVVMESFKDVAKDANLLMMSPAATSPQLTDISDDNLLWRTAPNDAFQGRAIAEFLLKEEDFEKIAIVNRDDVYGNGLRDVIYEHLCDSFPCSDTDRFYSTVYKKEAVSSEQSQTAIELEEFKPSITVLIGYFDDGTSFLSLAEKKGIQRFVVSDGLKSDKLTDLDVSPETLCRLVGTQPASPDVESYKSFELRFEAEYGEVGSYSANAYDAVYLLGYAIAASGIDNPTGADIAKGLGRLSSGDIVKAGTSDWNKTIQTLSSNPEATIDYEGASGPLNFDETGEAPSDIEGWVVDLDSKTTASLGTLFAYNGEVYTDLFQELSGLGETCSEARAVQCKNSSECAEGDYCDLSLATPICKAPPSGQGTACEDASDCASFEADYCETMVSFTCLIEGCDPTVNNCSPGYNCCDFASFGLPSLCVDAELSGGICTSGTTCEGNDDCAETEYCDLAMEEPTCVATPSGQGRACTAAEDCETFHASYCETMVSRTCLVPGCDKELNNCSPGYQCCDFAWLDLPSLCVDEVLSEGHCACETDEDCRAGDYCDLTLDTPACYKPPTGQGTACTQASDCESYEADYCDVQVTSTCLRQNCSLESNNCSPGYQCCDFGSLGLPTLCVDDATYLEECPL